MCLWKWYNEMACKFHAPCCPNYTWGTFLGEGLWPIHQTFWQLWATWPPKHHVKRLTGIEPLWSAWRHFISWAEHIVYTKSLGSQEKDGNTTEGDDAVLVTWLRNLFWKSYDDKMKRMIGQKCDVSGSGTTTKIVGVARLLWRDQVCIRQNSPFCWSNLFMKIHIHHPPTSTHYYALYYI